MNMKSVPCSKQGMVGKDQADDESARDEASVDEGLVGSCSGIEKTRCENLPL